MPKQKTPKKKIPLLKKSPIKKAPKPTKSFVSQTRKIALLLITLGMSFILIPALFYFNQAIQLSYFTPDTKAEIYDNRLQPIEITSSAVGMSVKVMPTVIKKGVWEVSPDGASYLSTSAKPGGKGSIILYAHNTPDRFGPIFNLQPDMLITLKTIDNKAYSYSVKKIIEVYPQQMEVFDNKEEALVIYTCSGFADLKRYIVIAKPAY
jgi:hypothetical protein